MVNLSLAGGINEMLAFRAVFVYIYGGGRSGSATGKHKKCGFSDTGPEMLRFFVLGHFSKIRRIAGAV